MGINVVLTDASPGLIAMRSPYDADFVADFKDALPYGCRAWDATSKVWLIQDYAEQDLLTFLQNYGTTITDKRGAGTGVIPQSGGVSPYDQMPPELREAFACLYLAPNAPLCVAEASYKALARIFHPDNAQFGNHDTMERINDAISTVRGFLGET